MQIQQKLQGIEIGQLVKRLADLRGNELKVDTPYDAATSPKEPAVANATINKRTVSYQTTYHPARVLTLLLRNWEQPVIMNGINWQPSTGSTKEQDRLLVYRQRLPLAGQPEMKKSPELHGNPAPAIKALGVEFSVPPIPGYPDWRRPTPERPRIPDAQWQHFGLNVWATVTPRLKLSDEAALGCQFLTHEDIPYLILGELAQAEVEEQTETAVQRAVEKLEEIIGARNFQTTMDAQEAAGSHSAYTCGESVRLNTNGECRAGADNTDGLRSDSKRIVRQSTLPEPKRWPRASIRTLRHRRHRFDCPQGGTPRRTRRRSTRAGTARPATTQRPSPQTLPEPSSSTEYQSTAGNTATGLRR